MSLYSDLKAHLPAAKSVVSDNEFLLLNRRDFHITQISPVHASMQSLGTKLGYPYRVLLALVDQIACSISSKYMNLVLTDPSLTLAAYQAWLRAGGGSNRVQIYAPKGVATLPHSKGLLGELIRDFASSVNQSPSGKPEEDRASYFTMVIGNTKSPEQTMFAVDRFIAAKTGVLILKDYSRTDAFDERDYLESKRIFPAITFEGHALAFKL